MMVIGAIMIAFSPIITKAVTLSPEMISIYRFGFGSIAIYLYIRLKGIKLDRENFKRSFIPIFLAGLFFALDLWFWNRSIIYIGAGISTLLANTQIFYLILISWIVFKERPNRLYFLAMFFASVGIGLVTRPYINFIEVDINLVGVLFGLLTGLAYAFVTTFMKRATQIYSGNTLWPILGITLTSLLFSVIGLLVKGSYSFGSQSDILWMLF